MVRGSLRSGFEDPELWKLTVKVLSTVPAEKEGHSPL
jgi:hypothetical protein